METFWCSFPNTTVILNPAITVAVAARTFSHSDNDADGMLLYPLTKNGPNDMNSEHALIVDDSKTAQHRLKRMLENFDLGIEIVSSAEEALAHLSYNQPAVIFLDHHMTGMSGMDALKTIKANPATALLPVIMYTSEKDDLFIGQARALGALGILSKSTMQASNIEQVLESLNIFPRGAAGKVSEEKTAVATAAPPVSTPVSVPVQALPELQQVRAQVGRLFEIHIAEVRNQINASTQFIVKRVSTMLDNKLHRDKLNEGAFLSRITVAGTAANRKNAYITHALIAVLLLGVAFCIYQLSQMQSDLQQASKDFQMATEAGKMENRHLVETVNQLSSNKQTEASRVANNTLPRAISLMQDSDFHFNYDEAPLSPLRVTNLSKIVSLLAEGGYTGPIEVTIHLGNVCLEPGTAADTWHVARSDVPATSCKMSKYLNPALSIDRFITPAYQTFQQTSAPIQDGRIRVQLSVNGYANPQVDYPLIRTSTTAGEWNNAALKNNRITLRFPGSIAQ